MNTTLLQRSLYISLFATLMAHAVFANIHKRIGDFTEKPSNVCARFVQEPITKASKKIAPWVPNVRPDITLPLLSCALYTLSKQVIPEVRDTKKVKDNRHIKAAINAFSMSLITANFHKCWNEDPYSTDWFLRNSVNMLLLTSNARSIYKTYAK